MSLQIRTLYREKKDDLKLELLAGGGGLDKRFITVVDIYRPMLALAGFTEYFLKERILIIGKTESAYLSILKAPQRTKAIRTVVGFGPPCVVVTEGLGIPKELITQANRNGVPLFRTSVSTTPFIHQLTGYLNIKLAPRCNIHGTLVDIFGVGVLLIGKAGIGKSELALDLLERGHRLIADDLILLTQRAGLLIGTGCEKSSRLKHYIEIRGVGIVDVFRVFGAKAVRNQKRIEVVVELVFWDETKDTYERTGITDRFKEILGVNISHIQIPLVPGKNVSTIVEVIAINQLLKLRGINPAQEYDEELKQVMKRKLIDEERTDEDLE